MCTLIINNAFNEQLEDNDQGEMIENRLKEMAFSANVQTSGLLDTTDTHIQRMPADLSSIRKRRIGRHRIYYTGFHTQCTYTGVFLKSFKQKGVDDDDDKRFQKKLLQALGAPVNKILKDPNDPKAEEAN